MSRIWFTSDYHMGHSNIIGLCERPFADIVEMERQIIARHNELIAPDDIVYDLGDFAYRCTAEHATECLRKLNGRRTVLWGNHDKPLRHAFRRGMLDDLTGSGKLTFAGSPEPGFQTGLRVVLDGQAIVMAHYAQRTWQGAFRGAWHLYGHSRDLAWNTCKSHHGPWRLSRSPALAYALTTRYFVEQGLPLLHANV